MVVYNGTAYSYAKNLQGDIVAILNSAGTAVVRYTYDAWGKPISCIGTMATTLGKLNPFRYRSYNYDEETGLYYLRSRYYSTFSNRFVNADSLICNNLFSYCDNAPVILADTNGQSLHLATSEFGGGGCSYISPSERTPEAVLKKGRRGKHKGKIPVGYLLAYLDQMVASGDWKYARNKMEWKNVDCIGMIRHAYQQYSQSLASNSKTYVGNMYSQAVAQGIEILPVAGNEQYLIPGMAIYWHDPTHKNEEGEIRPWYHIGVYVGDYVDVNSGIHYTDAVIEAASDSYNSVVALSLSSITARLSKTTTLYYGYLQDVAY